MNREQKRAFIRDARKRGIKKETAEAFIRAREIGLSKPSPPQHIKEGEPVILNVENIQARVNYNKMSDGYKSFVESSEGKIFTAHVERENLISLIEEPKWIFWSGDLIKIKTVNEPSEDVQQDS